MVERIPDFHTFPPGLRALRAFQEAHALGVAVCSAVARLGDGEERALLANQVRRAAVSIYGNVAEGHAKRTRAEQARYYDMALASLHEVQAHVAHGSARRLLERAIATELQTHARHTARLLTPLRDAVRRLADAERNRRVDA